MVQVWLQEIAWTEAQMPGRLAERNSRADSQQEHQLLQNEPMFCLETALKLQHWSATAYSVVGEAAKLFTDSQNKSTDRRLYSKDSKELVQGAKYSLGDCLQEGVLLYACHAPSALVALS